MHSWKAEPTARKLFRNALIFYLAKTTLILFSTYNKSAWCSSKCPASKKSAAGAVNHDINCSLFRLLWIKERSKWTSLFVWYQTTSAPWPGRYICPVLSVDIFCIALHITNQWISRGSSSQHLTDLSIRTYSHRTQVIHTPLRKPLPVVTPLVSSTGLYSVGSERDDRREIIALT